MPMEHLETEKNRLAYTYAVLVEIFGPYHCKGSAIKDFNAKEVKGWLADKKNTKSTVNHDLLNVDAIFKSPRVRGLVNRGTPMRIMKVGGEFRCSFAGLEQFDTLSKARLRVKQTTTMFLSRLEQAYTKTEQPERRSGKPRVPTKKVTRATTRTASRGAATKPPAVPSISVLCGKRSVMATRQQTHEASLKRRRPLEEKQDDSDDNDDDDDDDDEEEEEEEDDDDDDDFGSSRRVMRMSSFQAQWNPYASYESEEEADASSVCSWGGISVPSYCSDSELDSDFDYTEALQELNRKVDLVRWREQVVAQFSAWAGDLEEPLALHCLRVKASRLQRQSSLLERMCSRQGIYPYPVAVRLDFHADDDLLLLSAPAAPDYPSPSSDIHGATTATSGSSSSSRKKNKAGAGARSARSGLYHCDDDDDDDDYYEYGYDSDATPPHRVSYVFASGYRW
jgi:hypothetical protein